MDNVQFVDFLYNYCALKGSFDVAADKALNVVKFLNGAFQCDFSKLKTNGASFSNYCFLDDTPVDTLLEFSPELEFFSPDEERIPMFIHGLESWLTFCKNVFLKEDSSPRFQQMGVQAVCSMALVFGRMGAITPINSAVKNMLAKVWKDFFTPGRLPELLRIMFIDIFSVLFVNPDIDQFRAWRENPTIAPGEAPLFGIPDGDNTFVTLAFPRRVLGACAISPDVKNEMILFFSEYVFNCTNEKGLFCSLDMFTFLNEIIVLLLEEMLRSSITIKPILGLLMWLTKCANNTKENFVFENAISSFWVRLQSTPNGRRVIPKLLMFVD